MKIKITVTKKKNVCKEDEELRLGICLNFKINDVSKCKKIQNCTVVVSPYYFHTLKIMNMQWLTYKVHISCFFNFLDDLEMYVWGKNQKGCLGIYVAQQLDQSYPFRVIATTVVFVKKKEERSLFDVIIAICHLI